mgnify:CR=1 FL=1
MHTLHSSGEDLRDKTMLARHVSQHILWPFGVQHVTASHLFYKVSYEVLTKALLGLQGIIKVDKA